MGPYDLGLLKGYLASVFEHNELIVNTSVFGLNLIRFARFV